MNDEASSWVLVLEDDERALVGQVRLTEGSYRIGRGERCGVRIDDRNVSREHAELVLGSDGGWWVRDLGSTYGSFVNGERLGDKLRAVDVGDCLQVGDRLMTFRPEGLSAPLPSAFAAPLGQGGAGGELPPRLLVVHGPEAGHTVPLDQGPVTMGGVPEANAWLGGKDLADVAVLVRPLADGRHEVLNRGAGVLYLGLQRVEHALLSDGDLLFIEDAKGEVLLRLRYLAEGQQAPTCPGQPLPFGSVPSLPFGAHDAEPPSRFDSTTPTFDSVVFSIDPEPPTRDSLVFSIDAEPSAFDSVTPVFGTAMPALGSSPAFDSVTPAFGTAAPVLDASPSVVDSTTPTVVPPPPASLGGAAPPLTSSWPAVASSGPLTSSWPALASSGPLPSSRSVPPAAPSAPAALFAPSAALAPSAPLAPSAAPAPSGPSVSDLPPYVQTPWGDQSARRPSPQTTGGLPLRSSSERARWGAVAAGLVVMLGFGLGGWRMVASSRGPTRSEVAQAVKVGGVTPSGVGPGERGAGVGANDAGPRAGAAANVRAEVAANAEAKASDAVPVERAMGRVEARSGDTADSAADRQNGVRRATLRQAGAPGAGAASVGAAGVGASGAGAVSVGASGVGAAGAGASGAGAAGAGAAAAGAMKWGVGLAPKPGETDESMRVRLEQRVFGGQASPAEVQQLRQVCARLSDGGCRARLQRFLSSQARRP